MAVVSGRSLSSCSPHWSLLVFLTVFTWSWSTCLACPKPCACYVPTEIHCTFRYLNAIPESIQAHVERINLGYNNLMKLTNGSFSGLRHLQLLMLHSNKIQEIPDNAFKDLQSLQVLKMSYNKVKTLNREAFHGLRSIVRLHMDHNNIEFINPEAFYGLSTLKLLHLEGNMLQEIHRDTFVTFRFNQIFKVSSIKHLYLSENALTSIPSDLLSYISEIESIYLHGNKWFCDCNLKWLAELNERLPGVLKCKRDRNYPNGQICPVCANPSVSKGKDILQLPSSTFACMPSKIQSPLKIRSSAMEEEGDYALGHAKDFVAPLGQMSLNMSDQSGNGCEITCNVHRPVKTPDVMVDQKEDHVLLNTSLSTFLLCYVDYEKIQRLWGILAMYTDSPLKLERDTLLTETPSKSYLYKQPPTMDMHHFTGIQAEIRAEPSWLLHSEITLQLDRSMTTLNVLQIKYLIDFQVTFQDLEVKPGKNSWVMIKRASSVRTEHFVVMGGTVELECQAFGDPKPINEWILPDGSKVRAPYSSVDSRISVSADGKFRLSFADLYDTGIYHCVGTNYQDADVLSFRVTILDPSVSEKDINGPYISKSIGDSLQLPCQASGIPNATVRWVLPDHRVLDRTTTNKEITPNGTLMIKKLTLRDGGYYRCVASNRYGVDLLALQVTVSGPEKGSAENNDAAEDGLGSGESEEESLEFEETGRIHSQSATENTPDDKPDQATTPEPRTQPTTAAVAPRRRTGGGRRSRTRWRANRRTLKHPRKVDPKHWAEYLERARKNAAAKPTTTTRGITDKPQGGSQASPEGREASGDDQDSPVDEEFIAVTTRRPREVPITLVSPRIRPRGPHANGAPVVAQSPMLVQTTPPNEREATFPMSQVSTYPSLHPVPTDAIDKRRPGGVKAPTVTPQQPNAEGQMTSSDEILDLRVTHAPSPATMRMPTPEADIIPPGEHTTQVEVSKGGSLTISGVHHHPMTSKDHGHQVPLEPRHKATTSPPPLLSTTVSHTVTDASVSKPKLWGRRRKQPYRRRYGRPGVNKPWYSIVRPGRRRHGGSAMTQSHRNSAITEVPLRFPFPLSPPTQTEIAPMENAEVPPQPQIQLGRGSLEEDDRAISPDSNTQAPTWKTITQPPATSPSTSPNPTLLAIKRPTESPPQMIYSSTYTPTTMQPTSQPHKAVRGKIPWDRLFGFNSQRDVLRRLRKPMKGTGPKLVTQGTFVLTKPTLRDVVTSVPMVEPTVLPLTTPRTQDTTTGQTTRIPVTSAGEITSTIPPSTVGTAAVTTETTPITVTTTRATLTTRQRAFFRRRRPGKPFGRTKSRWFSSRPTSGRNRSAAENRKTILDRTKTRVAVTPTVPVTTKASLPVAVETSTWNIGAHWRRYPKTVVTTAPAIHYGPKPRVLSSPLIQPIATVPTTIPSPTAEDAGTTTTLAPTYAATKISRLPRISNRIRPVTPISGTSTTTALVTESSERPTTAAPTSSRALTTFQPTSKAVPRFRITLHRFGISPPRRRPPPMPPAFGKANPRWGMSHGRIFGSSSTISLSSTEAPSEHRATSPAPNVDLENAIEAGDSREDLSSEADPSSPNVIAVDPLIGQRSSKPRIADGTAASLTVLADSDAVLTCEASGNPHPAITWTKISTGATITVNAKRGNKFEVFANGTLSIQKIKVQDRGQYLCTAENQHGSDRMLVTLSVLALPSKILEPRVKDITVHSGYPVEMKCRSQGRPSPTISWMLSNKTMVKNSSPFNGRISVLADGTLRIKAVSVYDQGSYRCIASNPAGVHTVTVRIHVLAHPPSIFEDKRQTIKARTGENIRLPCTTEGNPPPSLRWLVFDGTEIKPLQFISTKLFVFTNGTLYIKSLKPSDSGNYECVATSSSGSEKRVVSLMVERHQERPKILAASPTKNKLNYGDKLQIHCLAAGDPKPQILWRLPSKIFVDQWHRRGGRVVVLFNGTLSIDSTTEKDAGDYLCIARNNAGEDMMSVKIDVSLKPALIEHKQSVHKHVSYGGDLHVDCKASGEPKPEISWSLPDGTMVNNVLQADDSGRRTRRYVVFGNGTLYYNKVGMAEEGDYTCYAQNTLGKDEMRVHVTVVASIPRINKSYKPFHKVKVGESAMFDCQAMGTPLPKILWMLPTNEIISFSKNRYHIQSNGSLLIKNVHFADAGKYMCIARNPGGDATSLLHLNVASTPPVINGFWGNRTVIEEAVVRQARKQMDCKAVGIPKPRIMWIMPDNILIHAPYYGSRIVVHPNGTLEIRNVRSSDKAEFTCVASNNVGKSTLVVILDITQMTRRPMFKNPFNQKLIAGNQVTAVFNCSADGIPPPEIIWILPNGTRFTSRPEAARYQMGSDGTFLIHSPVAEDAGKYRCAAKNKIGYIEKLIILEVAQKPVIHTHPLGLIRSTSGDSLSLHCSTSGSPVPTISWTVPSGSVLDRPQINARYILFENGTLVVREISTHDRGSYTCKAYNNAGISSQVTHVMVLAYAPRITNGPSKSIQSRGGSPVHLNCMAIGIPKPEIVWELPDHTVLSTFKNVRPTGREFLHPQGTLVIQMASVHDSGTYKCTARSHLGSDSRQTLLQII
ncbi:immunoglobulin superfamily member 10 [Amblyraja radiata]|uniref:immunoglobulin superfamily member 10 n=1 Tax=Amblyraja radiata TaxID=386614 RepID=UPI0014036209|nr:immunoglobulin superfamily member 10 [Amblyraja radiata]